MNRNGLIVIWLFVLSMMTWSGSAAEFADESPSPMEFRNPPLSARPGCFWDWLNGNITPEQITLDLEEMKDKGMSGGEIWDVAAIRAPKSIPAGPAFMSDESVKLIAHAINEATRLNLRLGLIASSGWNAGGSWVTPEYAGKALYYSSKRVTGPMKYSAQIPVAKKADYSKDIAILAFPYTPDKTIKDIASVINLTHMMDEKGILKWDVPEGKWVILRFTCANHGQKLIVPSPGSGGLMIDFMDTEATLFHMNYIMQRILSKLGRKDFRGTAFKCLEVDSMELGEFTPWTARFLQEFNKRCGYDLTAYLPVVAGWTMIDDETTAMFNYDRKKVVSDLVIFAHYETGRKLLNKYGLDLVGEAGGPGPPVWNTNPVDGLKALGAVDVPRGEFWIKHRNMFLVKEIASASHIYGKKYVDAESWTTWRRYIDDPVVYKLLGDRALCEGLNHFTFHTFASSPPEAGRPGRAYHAGTDINSQSTWWPVAKPFMDYLSRCSYMLQQGLFVGDVCYYYGDQAPNFYPLYHSVPKKIIPPELGFGYDYDVCNSEVILKRMSVKDGRIVLPDGMNYRLLALPDQNHMPLAVLKKIEQLVKDGAIVLGRRPTRANGLTDRQTQSSAVRHLAARLWGVPQNRMLRVESVDVRYGKGRVVSGKSWRQVLDEQGCTPDFIVEEDNGSLDYIHRRTDSADIYFIRNKTMEWQNHECVFREKGKRPEFWMPDTGKISLCPVFDFVDGGTRIPVRLAPADSVFVVFRGHAEKPRPKVPAGKITKISAVQEIAGPWELSFPKGWGAPESVSINSLKDWTLFSEPGIKYFSGTATYTTEFELPGSFFKRGFMQRLELGHVDEVAEVFINGKAVGIVWKPPWYIDVTSTVKPGRNTLVVKVTNLWANRLAYDTGLPKEKRLTWSNVGASGGGLASGLMGPVIIRAKDDGR